LIICVKQIYIAVLEENGGVHLVDDYTRLINYFNENHNVYFGEEEIRQSPHPLKGGKRKSHKRKSHKRKSHKRKN